MIIDTHCHLDDLRYDHDIEAVIERAKSGGVSKFIIPGADPATLPKAVCLAERYDGVYFAVGVHPYDARRYDRGVLEPFASHPKCVAVGECGLDYYRLPDGIEAVEVEKRVQKEIFIDQILWAKTLDKPLIVHIRDASLDCMELLERYGGARGGVLHCYNADEQLLKLAKRNFYYGIGGVLTFANARKLIQIYPKIPQDRLLIETDAPYLTPHPHRGERNEPLYTTFVAAKMGELSALETDKIESITTENAKKLFGI